MANDISTDLTKYMLAQPWGKSATKDVLLNRGEKPDVTQERRRLSRENINNRDLSKPFPEDAFAPWWHYADLVLYGDGFALRHLSSDSDDLQLKLIDFIDSHPTCTQEEFNSAIKGTTTNPAPVSHSQTTPLQIILLKRRTQMF